MLVVVQGKLIDSEKNEGTILIVYLHRVFLKFFLALTLFDWKKIHQSDLEFSLRMQEYIELIRARKLAEAIQYLRKWLTPSADNHMKEIQAASALLAFNPSTSCHRYKVDYLLIFPIFSPNPIATHYKPL